mgnify:CR=1 FL=1
MPAQSILGNGENTAGKVSAKSVKATRTIFTPGIGLKNQQKKLKYEKA